MVDILVVGGGQLGFVARVGQRLVVLAIVFLSDQVREVGSRGRVTGTEPIHAQDNVVPHSHDKPLEALRRILLGLEFLGRGFGSINARGSHGY
jgi:hypothetical protein